MSQCKIPQDECDLILKGGITSGVVYPAAIARLAKMHRFRNIGGSSAGAIGAAFAAAAEYRRVQQGDDAGFQHIAGLGDNLAQNLACLFQPDPPLRRIFAVFKRLVKGKKSVWILGGALLHCYWLGWVLSLLCGLVAVAAGMQDGQGWTLASHLFNMVAVLVFFAVPILQVVRDLRRLPEHGFGLCSGLEQPHGEGEGFTDWMHRHLEAIAGKADDGLVTIGDLRSAGIEFAAMTTDISSRRPYQLPLETEIHYFKRVEFEKLFPKEVVDYLAQEEEGQGEYIKLPTGDAMPLIVAVRLSVSFPLLIQAVPLYRVDNTLKQRGEFCRCLFSDGGISSNFPIHFFDTWLPIRPTFGIFLTDHDDDRHDRDQRVGFMGESKGGNGASALAVRPIGGLLDFAMAIVDTAKDWQDTLQTQLTGYRGRIVQVRLDPAYEGGLNLTMPPDIIRQLDGYGDEVGAVICADFDFQDHLHRRSLSFLPKLAAENQEFATRMQINQAQGYKVVDPDNPAFAQAPDAAIAEYARQFAALNTQAHEITSKTAHLPLMDADLRLTANADRVPRSKK